MTETREVEIAERQRERKEATGKLAITFSAITDIDYLLTALKEAREQRDAFAAAFQRELVVQPDDAFQRGADAARRECAEIAESVLKDLPNGGPEVPGGDIPTGYMLAAGAILNGIKRQFGLPVKERPGSAQARTPA